MAIEQWGFYSVPHILWHGASVYNGHLWRPVTFKLNANRLAVEISLPDFNVLGLSRLGFEHPASRLRGECSNQLRHLRGFIIYASNDWIWFGKMLFIIEFQMVCNEVWRVAFLWNTEKRAGNVTNLEMIWAFCNWALTKTNMSTSIFCTARTLIVF